MGVIHTVTAAQLVDPQHPINVVGIGGFRGSVGTNNHLDQLKPLIARVTDHIDDGGGVLGVDEPDTFALFESEHAGKPWLKIQQNTHLIHDSKALSKIRHTTRAVPGTRRPTLACMTFDQCVVGETVGIAYQDTTQPSPFQAPYVIASTDPVAEALAYQALVHLSTPAIEAFLDPTDPTTVFFEPADTFNIRVTYGFAVPAVVDVPLDHDVYFPYYNYSSF